jgi:septal ring factor EnvC (AmiA/AmiB activator)
MNQDNVVRVVYAGFMVLLVFLAIMSTGCVPYSHVERVNKRIDELSEEQQAQVAALNEQINVLTSALAAQGSALSSLQSQLEGLEAVDAGMQAQIDALQAALDAVEASVYDLQTRTAELETQEGIVEFVDPCGDMLGQFDEVLLRTSSGKLVAYFESGSRRFLTILSPGSYRTTDAQRCNFSINPAGAVSW